MGSEAVVTLHDGFHDAVRKTARFAGITKRYHGWPTLNRQNVAEHTWGVMMVWYQIWGQLPPHISTFLLWHDAGELVTGDPPFPLKANNPPLKAMIDSLEEQAVRDMGGASPELTAEEKLKAKFCDLIEMWQFGLIEMLMGNRLAQPIVRSTFKHIEKLRLAIEPGSNLYDEVNQPVWQYMHQFKKHLGWES